MGRSGCLTVLLLALHGGGTACLWWAGLPIPVQAGISLAVVSSCVWTLRLHGLRTAAAAVVFAAWERDGHWLIHTRGAGEYLAELVYPVFVHPFVSVLTLRQIDSRRRCLLLICADAADADQFRRLRVRLRHQPIESPRR